MHVRDSLHAANERSGYILRWIIGMLFKSIAVGVESIVDLLACRGYSLAPGFLLLLKECKNRSVIFD